MKIIHVVENLDKGAVENWLVRTYIKSRENEPGLDWTFYCILPEKGILEDIVIQNGGNVIHSPVLLSDKVSFLRHLRKVLKKGKYSIFHSHHDFLSGFYFFAFAGLGVQKKIIHVHNLAKSLPVGNRILHDFLIVVFRQISLLFYDIVIGVSSDALFDFTNRKNFKKGKVVFCGIAFNEYDPKIIKDDIRKELLVDPSTKIILFAGRLTRDKNPAFLVEILDGILQMNYGLNFCIVYLGEGEEGDSIKKQASKLGLSEKIHLVGYRKDLARFFSQSDIFIFPRFEAIKEGLGLVLVEAQAAGLPIITTEAIPKDAFVSEDLVTILNTQDSVSQWVNAVLEITSRPRLNQTIYFNKANYSRFSLDNSTIELLDIYKSEL